MLRLQQLTIQGMQCLRPAAPPLGAALAGGLLTALVFSMAGGRAATAQPGQPGELRTERLTVVGPDGAPRAVLGEVRVGDMQGKGLLVYDRDGRTPRVAVGMNTEGQAGMILFDPRGAARHQLFTGFEGGDQDSVTIMGLDPQGTARFELFFAPTPNGAGTAQVRVYDGAGQVRGNLAAFPDGGAVVDLLSSDPHRPRARLAMPPNGQPEIVLLDEAGTPIWRAP